MSPGAHSSPWSSEVCPKPPPGRHFSSPAVPPPVALLATVSGGKCSQHCKESWHLRGWPLASSLQGNSLDGAMWFGGAVFGAWFYCPWASSGRDAWGDGLQVPLHLGPCLPAQPMATTSREMACAVYISHRRRTRQERRNRRTGLLSAPALVGSVDASAEPRVLSLPAVALPLTKPRISTSHFSERPPGWDGNSLEDPGYPTGFTETKESSYFT